MVTERQVYRTMFINGYKWKTIFNGIYLTLPQWPPVKLFSLKGGDVAFWYFFYVIQISQP